MRRRIGLSTPVLIGLGAGGGLGLFIGEGAPVLQGWGGASVQPLQGAVLPYVAVSLVGGLGPLNRREAPRLGARFAILPAGLWVVALLAVFAFPLVFPSI